MSELQYLIPLNSYVRRRKKKHWIETNQKPFHGQYNRIYFIPCVWVRKLSFFFLVNLPSKCVNVWDFEMSVFMSTVNSFITYANQFRRLKLFTQIQTSIDQQNNFCFEKFLFLFYSLVRSEFSWISLQLIQIITIFFLISF